VQSNEDIYLQRLREPSNQYRMHTYGSPESDWDNPGEPVPEETFTHAYLSWSSVVLYLLHPSNMIHDTLHIQFTCLTSVDISVNANLELVDKFCYLGDMLSADGDADVPVETRIRIG